MSIRLAATGCGKATRLAPRDFALVWVPTAGLSPESEDLRASISEIRRELHTAVSLSWRDTLREELAALVRDCSSTGWDGYEAEALSVDAEVAALQLIEVLPEYIATPDLTPMATGEIAFEWRKGRDVYFTIRASGRRLGYAGVFGGFCKKYGQEQFFDSLPTAIQAILTHHFPSI